MNPLTKKLLVLGASSVIAVAGGYLIQPWEGSSNKAYKDLVGVPTICMGETKGVKMGDYKTDEECEKSLASELASYNKSMKKYVKEPITEYEEVAYTSFIWNLGETNWRTSTILKKLNAGDHYGACQQLLRWNMAGGRVVKGLDNRRKDEFKTCTGGNGDVNAALAELTLNGEGSIDTQDVEGSQKPLEASNASNSSPSTNSTPEVVVEPSRPTHKPCKLQLFGLCLL